VKLIKPIFNEYKALEIYEYIKETLEDLKKTNFVNGALQSLYNQVEPAFTLYDQATYHDRALPLTDELKKHDTARDHAYTGLHYTFRGLTYHYNTAYAEAARVLLGVFKKYPAATREGYNEESGIIANLCQDLLTARTPGRVALDTLDTTDLRLLKWVENLREHNTQFGKLMDERYADLGKAAAVPLIKDTRPAAVTGIVTILEKIAALVTADVNLAITEPLLAQINQRTEKYNTVARARRKRHEDAEADEISPER
jgi:hypothetical protein